jgi:uncharacterized protein YjcR
MAYDTSTRRKVRTHYVQGLVLTTAASKVGVPYNTARNWKRQAADEGDDWDIARAANRMTRGGVEEMVAEVLPRLALQFMATMDALEKDKHLKSADRSKAMNQLMDAYTKAVAASTRGAPNTNRLATAMDVVRWMGKMVKARLPKMHAPFVNLCEELGSDILREFGAGGGQ